MQDGKNLIIAILLCLVVIVGWSYLSEYMGWVRKPDPAVVAQQQQEQLSMLQEAVLRQTGGSNQQSAGIPAEAPV